MFNQPFLLFLLDKIPQVEFIEHFSTAVSEIMEQVEIDVARSRLPEGCFKLPDSIFASRVCPRRVKIGAARIHEQIDHLLCLLNVDFSVFLRQTHQAKAEFFNMLAKICHYVPLTYAHSILLRVHFKASDLFYHFTLGKVWCNM